MTRPKTETEDLKLSITKNCETLIKQTHTKPQETLEFKMVKSKETLQFNPPVEVKEDWMIGLKSLEVYESIYNINTTNNKVELYTDTFYDFSFEELKDEVEEILNCSDITPYHLQHEKIGPRKIQAYKKLRLDKSKTDGYILLLLGYVRSPFRDFESYLITLVGSDEDDIQLMLEHYDQIFITFELSPSIYTIEDISKTVYTMGDHRGTLQIEYDDETMKTKFNLTQFG